MKGVQCWIVMLLAVLVLSCENKDTIDDPGQLSLVFQISHVSIFGGNNGEIHTTVSGGTALTGHTEPTARIYMILLPGFTI